MVSSAPNLNNCVTKRMSMCINQSTVWQFHSYILGNDQSGQWELLCTRHKRSWDTIALPSALKDSILQDIETFRNNKEFYYKNGLRYKRIILLSGPPGTGKSCLIEALVSKLNLKLCYLTPTIQLQDGHLIETQSDLRRTRRGHWRHWFVRVLRWVKKATIGKHNCRTPHC